jgi:hypothetical protein
MEDIFLAYAGLLSLAAIVVYAGAWGSLPVCLELFLSRAFAETRTCHVQLCLLYSLHAKTLLPRELMKKTRMMSKTLMKGSEDCQY